MEEIFVFDESSGEFISAERLQVDLSWIITPRLFGIFETLLVYNGRPVLAKEHLKRMKGSAEYFGLPVPEERDLENAVFKLAGSFGEMTFGLRISLIKNPIDGKSVLIAQSRNVNLSFKEPLKARLGISRFVRQNSNELACHKIFFSSELALAADEAKARGFDDMILLSNKGKVLETTRANIFFFDGERIITPPVEDGLLPGIIRQLVLENCRKWLGVEAVERSFLREEILQFKEVFITNSLMPVSSVQEIEGRFFNACKLGLELQNVLLEVLSKS